MRTLARSVLLAAAAAPLVAVAALPQSAARAQTSPITHIVVLDLENHSFDNLLGFWCQSNPRCGPGDAMPATVTLSNGAVVTPAADPDVVPVVSHTVRSQLAAMDGGRMDGWQNITGGTCDASTGYQCVSGYTPSQVPNIVSLAGAYAMSDRFFSLADSPSWGGHLYAVAATLDGFNGDNPGGGGHGPGWGCDSGKLARRADGTLAPSCVPDPSLNPAQYPYGGASGPTPAAWVPTIMDRLDGAGLAWKIYGTATAQSGFGSGYQWAVCPSFAGCLDTSQRQNLTDSGQFFTDAAAGNLPSWSLITAGGTASGGARDSCHNGFSMTACDDYVGRVAAAVENSPQWPSTVLLITWDDFGGFYDGVPPGTSPDGTQQGPRLPLIAVSPYAVPASTDSTPASFASILAFTEQTFGLSPLGVNDADAYNLSGMFNLAAAPHLANRPRMVMRPVPAGDRIVWPQGGEDS